jgi:hypothetical protein
MLCCKELKLAVLLPYSMQQDDAFSNRLLMQVMVGKLSCVKFFPFKCVLVWQGAFSTGIFPRCACTALLSCRWTSSVMCPT